jgi:hypothetical protein
MTYKFLGWQQVPDGDPIPCYHIVGPVGHPKYQSTVFWPPYRTPDHDDVFIGGPLDDIPASKTTSQCSGCSRKHKQNCDQPHCKIPFHSEWCSDMSSNEGDCTDFKQREIIPENPKDIKI